MVVLVVADGAYIGYFRVVVLELDLCENTFVHIIVEKNQESIKLSQ